MKVSVIIPVYNVRPYLERCIQSVLCQTYKDLEIILVDDGSTDGSGELVDQLSDLDSRINVIHQKNQGQSSARNNGLFIARGEYVVFLDSDDEWLVADGLEKLLKDVDRNKSDLILFKCVNIWNDTRIVPTKDYDIKHIQSLGDGSAVFDYLVRIQRFNMSACFLLVRRELLIQNNIFFPVGYISEDLYWSLHLWQHAVNVLVMNLDFYGYWHRPSSITTTSSIRAYESYDKIFDYWNTMCEQGCKNADSIRLYLANMWVNRGYAYIFQKEEDKPRALAVLEKHKKLLDNGISPKSCRVKKMVRFLGVKKTAELLGLYWHLRKWLEEHAL